jgi:hypothetical protein
MNNLVIKRSQLVEFQITGTPTTLRRYTARTVQNFHVTTLSFMGLNVTPKTNWQQPLQVVQSLTQPMQTKWY